MPLVMSLSDWVYVPRRRAEPRRGHARRPCRRTTHVIEAYLGTPREQRSRSRPRRRRRRSRPRRPSAEVLLELKGVDVFYDKVQVLYDVDFDVRRGERVALLGTNGAGKSTDPARPPPASCRPTAGHRAWKGEDVTATWRRGARAQGPRPRARRARAVPDAHGRARTCGWAATCSTRQGQIDAEIERVIELLPVDHATGSTSRPARCRVASSSSWPCARALMVRARPADDRRAVARARTDRHRAADGDRAAAARRGGPHHRDRRAAGELRPRATPTAPTSWRRARSATRGRRPGCRSPRPAPLGVPRRRGRRVRRTMMFAALTDEILSRLAIGVSRGPDHTACSRSASCSSTRAAGSSTSPTPTSGSSSPSCAGG